MSTWRKNTLLGLVSDNFENVTSIEDDNRNKNLVIPYKKNQRR